MLRTKLGGSFHRSGMSRLGTGTGTVGAGVLAIELAAEATPPGSVGALEQAAKATRASNRALHPT